MSGMLHQGYEACSQHIPPLCPSTPVSRADTRVARGRQETGQSRLSYPASTPRCFPVSGAASAPRTHCWSTSKDSRPESVHSSPQGQVPATAPTLLSCPLLSGTGKSRVLRCRDLPGTASPLEMLEVRIAHVKATAEARGEARRIPLWWVSWLFLCLLLPEPLDDSVEVSRCILRLMMASLSKRPSAHNLKVASDPGC